MGSWFVSWQCCSHRTERWSMKVTQSSRISLGCNGSACSWVNWIVFWWRSVCPLSVRHQCRLGDLAARELADINLQSGKPALVLYSLIQHHIKHEWCHVNITETYSSRSLKSGDRTVNISFTWKTTMYISTQIKPVATIQVFHEWVSSRQEFRVWSLTASLTGETLCLWGFETMAWH